MWLAMVLIVLLLLALVWLTQVREGFVDIPTLDLSEIPDPQVVLKQVRALLDKYDRPEIWNHTIQMMDKDPGQLARLNLGIDN